MCEVALSLRIISVPFCFFYRVMRIKSQDVRLSHAGIAPKRHINVSSNFTPSASHTIVVYIRSCPSKTYGNIPIAAPLTEASNAGGVRKIAIFDQTCGFISETIQVRAMIVTMECR